MDKYEKIMNLAKRRGFIYPSFEIYGGAAGLYSYGPLGTLLKENVKNLWRYFYVLNEGFIEIDTPTLTPFEVLKASGHVDEFTDLKAFCKKCKKSYKAEDVKRGDKLVCPSCGGEIKETSQMNLMFSTILGEDRKAFLRPETAQGIFTDFHLLYRFVREKMPFGVAQIGKGYRNEISPRQGVIRLREFSMAEVEVFYDPKNMNMDPSNLKGELPLVVDGEVKKMDLKEAVEKGIIENPALAYHILLAYKFMVACGIDDEKIRVRKHRKDELAHYAKECWDIESYSERFGWVECVGIADRSAYDLTAHTKASGVDLCASRRGEGRIKKKIVAKLNVLGPIFKELTGRIKEELEKMEPPAEKKEITLDVDGKKIVIPEDGYEIVEEKESVERFIPHVIEPSFGIDRIIYFILEHSYVETEKRGEKYNLLRLPAYIAPIKAGVFPLVNDDRLCKIAKEIEREMRLEGLQVFYDDTGSIGRRYARMDEIGTPFCITVDFTTLEDDTVTVRYRDTTEQERIKRKDVPSFIKNQISESLKNIFND